MTLITLDEAEKDFVESAAYYESREKGLDRDSETRLRRRSIGSRDFLRRRGYAPRDIAE